MFTAALQTYKNAYSGLSRRMWLLSVVMFINRCGTMVLPFMTLYCNHRGYTERQGGFAVAVYGLGSLVGASIGGRLSDRFGFYYTQFCALFFGGVMFMLLGQMQSYTTICICIFFTSMTNEAFRPANSSAIAYYSNVQNRTQSFSLNRLAINLGWGVGSAVAGMLASISYNLLFWADGITNIAAAVVLLALLPKVTLAQQKTTHKTNTDIKTKGPLQDKPFVMFVCFMLLFSFCFFQLFTTVPLFFKEGLHLTEFQIGAVMAMNGIIIAFFEMVIVFKLEGTMPYLKLMFYGTLLMALSFVLLNLPLDSGLAVAIIAIFMVTVAEIVAMPFMNSYYIARTTPENRGRYAALYTQSWSCSQVLGSLSGAYIIHALGFTSLWWILSGISVMAALGYRYLMRKE
jgi:predicted MFS family arabinose efflux permease